MDSGFIISLGIVVGVIALSRVCDFLPPGPTRKHAVLRGCWFLVVLGLVATACSSGDSGTEVATTTIPTPASTTTTLPSTTTTTFPPEPGLEFDTLLVWRVGDVHEPALLFSNPEGTNQLQLPIDRRVPLSDWRSAAVTDLEGGLMITGGQGASLPGGLVLRIENSSDNPQVLEVGEIDDVHLWPSVVRFHDEPALFYVKTSWDTWAEGELDLFETHSEVLAQPIEDGVATSLFDNVVRETFQEGVYTSDGPWLIRTGYGGDMLMLQWATEDCGWLEFRDETGQVVDVAGNPEPSPGACGSVRFVDPMISRDGKWLVGQVLHLDGTGSYLTVVELSSGAELGRFEGQTAFFDGATTLVAVTGLDDPDAVTGYRLVEWGTGRVVETVLDPPDGVLLGIIGEQTLISRELSLEELPLPTTCSSSGRQATLPEQSGLPPAVASTRQAIADAASECDFMTLFELANANSEWFTIAAHGICDEPVPSKIGDIDPIPLWFEGDLHHGEMSTLTQILAEPYAIEEDEQGTVYVWPDEGHNDYRLGIREDGSWAWIVRGFYEEPCETIWCTC